MNTLNAVGGAFGVAKAGLPFDPVEFLKRPQVILRLVSWVFSIIVFGCISSEGWQVSKTLGTVYCQYNGDASACNFGTAIGVLAFMACVIFLVIDSQFDSMSNIKQRKYVVFADLGFSGAWTFMWFVCFCYLTDSWRRAQDTRDDHIAGDMGRNNMQAAIAFSFFSIPCWAGLTFFAFQRYRTGIGEEFTSAPGYGDDVAANQAGYAPYPGAPDATGMPPPQQQAGQYSQQGVPGQQQYGQPPQQAVGGQFGQQPVGDYPQPAY